MSKRPSAPQIPCQILLVNEDGVNWYRAALERPSQPARAKGIWIRQLSSANKKSMNGIGFEVICDQSERESDFATQMNMLMLARSHLVKTLVNCTELIQAAIQTFSIKELTLADAVAATKLPEPAEGLLSILQGELFVQHQQETGVVTVTSSRPRLVQHTAARQDGGWRIGTKVFNDFTDAQYQRLLAQPDLDFNFTFLNDERILSRFGAATAWVSPARISTKDAAQMQQDALRARLLRAVDSARVSLLAIEGRALSAIEQEISARNNKEVMPSH